MVITIAITVAFMVLCFATDLRERMIYAFPCMTLIALWTVLGVISTGQYMLIGIAVSVHLAIYFALKIIGIWGDGDSDVFLLYGIIFIYNSRYSVANLTAYYNILTGIISGRYYERCEKC